MVQGDENHDPDKLARIQRLRCEEKRLREQGLFCCSLFNSSRLELCTLPVIRERAIVEKMRIEKLALEAYILQKFASKDASEAYILQKFASKNPHQP